MAKMKIGDFLFERKGRYKPTDKAIQGLKRIEKIDFNGNFHIGDKPSKTNMILVKKGDLVISGINVAKGAMGIYQGNEDVVATIHYSSYTFDKSIINVGYFKRFLKSAEFIKLLKEQVKGGIKTEIKPKHILPLEINLPDIKTQIKIVEKFESVETDIENINSEVQTQQTLLKKLRQAILQEAIEGKLTASWREENPDVESASVLLEKIKHEKEQLTKEKKIKKQKPLPPISEDEMPFEIPDSWEWCRLNTLVSILGDGLHGTPHYKENQKCYFINGNNLSNGKIIFKDSTKTVSDIEYEKYKKPLTNRTILVSINGTLGNVAFYNNEYIILGKSACYFNLLNFIDKEYIKFIIESQYFLEYAVRMSSKTTINNLSLKNMNLLPISLPPLEEQKEMVKKIENHFAICDELQTQIKASKKSSQTLMQAVLKEAFEG